MRFWVNVFAFMLVACLASAVPLAFAASGEEAEAAVAVAEVRLRGAFAACLDAEAAGANVTGLMTRLSLAGVELSGARVSLAAGNFSDAVSRAEACRGLADGVSGDANALRTDAVAQAAGWWVTVLLSAAGSVVFVCVLFLVWRRFKRVYGDRLLKCRPEVAA